MSSQTYVHVRIQIPCVTVCLCVSATQSLRDVVLPLLDAVAIKAAATVPLGKIVVLAWQGGRAVTLWFGTPQSIKTHCFCPYGLYPKKTHTT